MRRVDSPLLAISFRWRDTHSAVLHYRPFLAEVKRQAKKEGVQLLGHGHPLKFDTDFVHLWREHGIESTPSFEEVLARADVYAADCSSSSFEFVCLDKPVIFLHDPKYDKMSFAPRFTQCHAGIINKDPSQLIADTIRAYQDPPEIAAQRRQVKELLFGDYRGEASQNAAKALIEFYD